MQENIHTLVFNLNQSLKSASSWTFLNPVPWLQNIVTFYPSVPNRAFFKVVSNLGPLILPCTSDINLSFALNLLGLAELS